MAPAPYRVTHVQVLGHWRLRLAFADGLVGDVNLSDLREHRGSVFRPLRDPRYFSKVFVDEELGTVAWPNGADLAPEVLYEETSHEPGSGSPDTPVGGGSAPPTLQVLSGSREDEPVVPEAIRRAVRALWKRENSGRSRGGGAGA